VWAAAGVDVAGVPGVELHSRHSTFMLLESASLSTLSNVGMAAVSSEPLTVLPACLFTPRRVIQQ
jgi:hypothetical protein